MWDKREEGEVENIQRAHTKVFFFILHEAKKLFMLKNRFPRFLTWLLCLWRVFSPRKPRAQLALNPIPIGDKSSKMLLARPPLLLIFTRPEVKTKNLRHPPLPVMCPSTMKRGHVLMELNNHFVGQRSGGKEEGRVTRKDRWRLLSKSKLTNDILQITSLFFSNQDSTRQKRTK